MILAVETSSVRGGVCVFHQNKVLAERVSARQRSHAEVLHPFIQEILTESGVTLAQLDAFAVGLGPGSFTGIRVAANTAIGLAFAVDKKIVGVDSLVQVAAQIPSTETRKILVAANAFRQQLYTATYQYEAGKLKVLNPPAAQPVDEVLAGVQAPTLVCGDGTSFLEPLSKDPATAARLEYRHELGPSAESLARIAAEVLAGRSDLGQVFAWNEFRPLYLRASEAEEKLLQK